MKREEKKRGRERERKREKNRKVILAFLCSAHEDEYNEGTLHKPSPASLSQSPRRPHSGHSETLILGGM